MTRFVKDEQLYSKLADILDNYKIAHKSNGDIIDVLWNKILYNDLIDDAQALVDAGVEQSVLRQELYQLKEESYGRRIDEIERALKFKGLGRFQYDYDLEKQRARKTDHKTKYSKVSAEVYHNELLRQLSDLPYGNEIKNGRLYVKTPDIIDDLREQLVELTEEEYQIPKTTVKREFVTLRDKIGRKLVEQAGLSKQISAEDPHYGYRFLADRWNKIVQKSKDNPPILKDFISQQLFHLQSDVSVLKAYKDLTSQLVQKGIVASDIKVTDNLFVRDKIQEYRKQLSNVLGNNLYQVVDTVGTHNPAYLDLVESQKKSNPTLYQETVKELAKDLGFWDKKTQSLVNKNVPLSSWQKISVDIRAIKEQQKQSYELIIADDKDKIEKARKKIIDIKQQQIANLTDDITQSEQKNHDVTKKRKLLSSLEERLEHFKQKNYDYDNIKSYKIREAVIRSTASELSIKADILEQDPAFNFNKALQGVKPSDRVDILKVAKQDLLMTTKPAVESYEWQYSQNKFSAPSWLKKRSLEEQLSWYRNAKEKLQEISEKNFDEFSTWISKQDYDALRKQLPVGYLQRKNDKVYRSAVDIDLLSEISRKENIFKDREKRILMGPTGVQPSVQTNSFGSWLQQNRTPDSSLSERTTQLFNDFTSDGYTALSEKEREFYDRNYGKPVKEGNTFYRSIYDMPSDIWQRTEKAAGYDIPRTRNGMISNPDINVAEEEAFQRKLSEELKARTWEPVKPVKEEKSTSTNFREEPISVVENRIVQQKSKDNLRRILSAANKTVHHNSMGTMGVLGAIALFNVAMSGPSEEAQAHRRRVEEERRQKKYGYY